MSQVLDKHLGAIPVLHKPRISTLILETDIRRLVKRAAERGWIRYAPEPVKIEEPRVKE